MLRSEDVRISPAAPVSKKRKNISLKDESKFQKKLDFKSKILTNSEPIKIDNNALNESSKLCKSSETVFDDCDVIMSGCISPKSSTSNSNCNKTPDYAKKPRVSLDQSKESENSNTFTSIKTDLIIVSPSKKSKTKKLVSDKQKQNKKSKKENNARKIFNTDKSSALPDISVLYPIPPDSSYQRDIIDSCTSSTESKSSFDLNLVQKKTEKVKNVTKKNNKKISKVETNNKKSFKDNSDNLTLKTTSQSKVKKNRTDILDNPKNENLLVISPKAKIITSPKDSDSPILNRSMRENSTGIINIEVDFHTKESFKDKQKSPSNSNNRPNLQSSTIKKPTTKKEIISKCVLNASLSQEISSKKIDVFASSSSIPNTRLRKSKLTANIKHNFFAKDDSYGPKVTNPSPLDINVIKKIKLRYSLPPNFIFPKVKSLPTENDLFLSKTTCLLEPGFEVKKIDTNPEESNTTLLDNGLSNDLPLKEFLDESLEKISCESKAGGIIKAPPPIIKENLDNHPENASETKNTPYFFLHSNLKKEIEKKNSNNVPEDGLESAIVIKDSNKRCKVSDLKKDKIKSNNSSDVITIDDFDFNKAKKFSKIKSKSIILVPWPGQIFGSNEHVNFPTVIDDVAERPLKIKFQLKAKLPEIPFDPHPNCLLKRSCELDINCCFKPSLFQIESYNLLLNNKNSIKDKSFSSPTKSTIPLSKVDSWKNYLSDIPKERSYNKRILSSIIDSSAGNYHGIFAGQSNNRENLISEKYAPKCTSDIIGNANAVNILSLWLRSCSLSKTDKSISEPRSSKKIKLGTSTPTNSEIQMSELLAKGNDSCHTLPILKKRLKSVYSETYQKNENIVQSNDNPSTINNSSVDAINNDFIISGTTRPSLDPNLTDTPTKKPLIGNSDFFSKKNKNLKEISGTVETTPIALFHKESLSVTAENVQNQLIKGKAKKSKKMPVNKIVKIRSKNKKSDPNDLPFEPSEFSKEELDFFQNYEFSSSDKNSLLGKRHLFGRIDDPSSNISNDKVKKPFSILNRIDQQTTPVKNNLQSYENFGRPILKKEQKGSNNLMNLSSESNDVDVGIALLVGPSGSGKTAAVYALANEFNYYVHEINASDIRSGKVLMAQLQELVKSHVVIGGSGNKFMQKQNVAKNFFSMKGANKTKKQNINESGIDNLKAKQGIESGNGNSSELMEFEVPLHKANPKSELKEVLILIENIDLIFEQDAGMLVALEMISTKSKRPIIATCSSIEKNSTNVQLSDLNFRRIIQFNYPSLDELCTYISLILINETGINHNLFRHDVIKKICSDCNCNLWRAMTFVGDFLSNKNFLESLSDADISNNQPDNIAEGFKAISNNNDDSFKSLPASSQILKTPINDELSTTTKSPISSDTGNHKFTINDIEKSISLHDFKNIKLPNNISKNQDNIGLSLLVKSSLQTPCIKCDFYYTWIEYLYTNPSTILIADYKINHKQNSLPPISSYSHPSKENDLQPKVLEPLENNNISTPKNDKLTEHEIVSDLYKLSKSYDLMADIDNLLYSVPEMGENFWEPIYEINSDFSFPDSTLNANYVALDSRLAPNNSETKCDDLKIPLYTYKDFKNFRENLEIRLLHKYLNATHDPEDSIKKTELSPRIFDDRIRSFGILSPNDYINNLPSADIKGESNNFFIKNDEGSINFSKTIPPLPISKSPVCENNELLEIPKIEFQSFFSSLSGESKLQRHLSLVGSSVRYIPLSNKIFIDYLPYLATIAKFDKQMSKFILNMKNETSEFVENFDRLQRVYNSKMVNKGGRSTRNSKYQYNPHLDWMDEETISKVIQNSYF
ncbi:ATPase family AAA domain-containing protein 5 [Smittium culicis]|uniref:ATPase family AAA domain-containing protein 5 n=1 Tax=Smittium culicis TaxID=133412 RepID=A0A1R1YR20_9FUNG|nr:ATPase family AAA domain-containing protein 5 [Smittium culicis]